MTNLIIATSTKEQQEIMSFLKENLSLNFHSDTSVHIIQSSLTRIDVYQSIKGVKNFVKSYRVIIVPVSMSLDVLRGYSHDTNININRLLEKLDRMKAEAIMFVNSNKKVYNMVSRQKEALSKAAKLLFDN